jgi:hypothetical protein
MRYTKGCAARAFPNKQPKTPPRPCLPPSSGHRCGGISLVSRTLLSTHQFSTGRLLPEPHFSLHKRQIDRGRLWSERAVRDHHGVAWARGRPVPRAAQSKQRSSVLSAGDAKKYRHRTHCRFTMPSGGSHGSALDRRRQPLSGCAAPVRQYGCLFLKPQRLNSAGQMDRAERPELPVAAGAGEGLLRLLCRRR